MIATGGMAEVYEAIHTGLCKPVALKVLRPDLRDNPEARRRFVSEGVHASRILHSNVVDVTDVGMVDDLPYLVMTLLEGEDLGAIYDREGRLPVADLVDLLLPVASAVALGHAHDVVHRDLKPENIFLHREGARVIPKLLDFGVSHVINARPANSNASVFGTPHYMSPEQARGEATDTRTDQYALGVMLYEGLTGRLPRDSANPLELLHAVAFDSFRPPSHHLPLPAELEAVILRAMSSNALDRFASMRELALALLPFASESAREYWSVELSSLPLTAATSTSLRAIARQPRQSPLMSEPVARSSAPPLAQPTFAARPSPLAAAEPQVPCVAPAARAREPRRAVVWSAVAAGALLAFSATWWVGDLLEATREVVFALPVAGNSARAVETETPVPSAITAAPETTAEPVATRLRAKPAPGGAKRRAATEPDPARAHVALPLASSNEHAPIPNSSPTLRAAPTLVPLDKPHHAAANPTRADRD